LKDVKPIRFNVRRHGRRSVLGMTIGTTRWAELDIVRSDVVQPSPDDERNLALDGMIHSVAFFEFALLQQAFVFDNPTRQS
jgi:hypothetical protein